MIRRAFNVVRCAIDRALCGVLDHEVARNARRTTCYECGWFYDHTE